MKHFYTEINQVTLMFSDIKTNPDGLDTIALHYEKPIPEGFAFLDLSLPTLYITKSYGFSEDEIYHLVQYAKNNAPLIWKLAFAYSEGEKKIAANY